MKKYITKIKKNQKKTVVIDRSGEYIVELVGENAEANIVGILMGDSDKKFVVRTLQLHKAPNTTSDLLLKSVLRDSSQIDYQGVIKIVKGAQKSNAYQRNENLLLSKDVKVESKPELEIEADDVRCTHAATMGMIDQDQVFYLKSRGLTKKISEQIIVEGFVQDVYDRISADTVKWFMSNQEIDLNLYQLDAKTEMKNQQSNGMFKTIVDAFAYRHISPFATAVYPRYYQLGFSLFSIVAVLQSLGQETDVPIDNYTLIKQNES